MLMVELDPEELMFLPTPDGREIRVHSPSDAAGPQAVTITVPGLLETDQILLVVGGRRMSIMGGKRKSSKTRLAINLPDSCRIRYSNRGRKPRKGA